MKPHSARIVSDASVWTSGARAGDVRTLNTPARHTSALLRLLTALRLFALRHCADVIHTTGARATITYGLCCWALRVPSRQVISEVYLNESTDRVKRWWHRRLLRLVMPRALGVIVPSSGQVQAMSERFGVSPDRVRYVPMYTPLEPEEMGVDGNLILSAGYSRRDFATLVEAVAGLDAQLVIVAPRSALEGLDVPPNTVVLGEVSRDEYLDQLRRAAIAAVILDTEEIPAGQFVILEAWAFGKPVVATTNVGTVDYVRDGENGFLCRMFDAAELRTKLQALLEDAHLRSRLGKNGLADVRRQFTLDGYQSALIQAFEDLAGFQQASRNLTAEHPAMLNESRTHRD